MKMQILKYEMKKIFCKKSTVLSLIGLVIFLALNTIPYISSTSYTNADGTDTKGLEAVRLMKNDKMKWNGVLTTEAIRKVLEKNQAIISDKKYASIKNIGDTRMNDTQIKLSNMQYAEKQGFSDIRDLLNDSFCKIHYSDYYMTDRLKPDAAVRFYPNRVSQQKTFLLSKEADVHLTKNEKNYIINSAETLHTPLKYSYADGWMAAFEKSMAVTYGAVFIICILMASIFSVEYQTGSDAILLSTEHGRKKGIMYKLIAGLLSISLVYWITSFIVYGIIFMIFGVEGGDCPIQAHFEGWKSFYHITNSQAFWMIVLLGYLACLFIGVLAMYLSSKAKSSFATIVFLVLILMIPAVIGKSLDLNPGSLCGQILSVFPDQMLTSVNFVQTWTLYDIGGKVLTPFQILPVLYGLLTIVLLPMTYNTFRKRQVA
jgi:ABC-type transport system involved in multi-copper enzyme maturation permease subunit